MQKAIQLQVHLIVTLHMEGEDEPAHDFAQSTSQAVRDMLQAGAASHPELQVTVQNVLEAPNDDASPEDRSDARLAKPAPAKRRAVHNRNSTRK